jgi:hypothetical protein
MLFTTNYLHYMFTKHNNETKTTFSYSNVSVRWSMILYYTHGPLQSVDHLYVMRNQDIYILTRWIHGGVSIPTAKETVCDYKVLCYLYMVMATDIYG